MRSPHGILNRCGVLVLVAVTLLAFGQPLSGTARPASGESPKTSTASNVVRIKVLSTRADLISGGDALVEIVLPERATAKNLKVTAGRRDVTKAFAPRAQQDGRILGLVKGLRLGRNVLTARLPDGRGARITITNHPVGGPVFTGPQLQPWACTTEDNGLGPATDKKCNVPTRYLFFYKNAESGEFEPYDRDNPPPDEQIATTTTDEGKTVPYIVRVETGTVNRGIYDIAELFDPSQPWKPWAPQAGWNGKLYWVFGCSASPGFGQGTHRACAASSEGPPEQQVLVDYALSRGFAVAASTLTNLGNNLNIVVQAETMMMVKEHIIEDYGPIRYTIGRGGSGGAMTQYGIANQYPGLLDGASPSYSFSDLWSILAVGSIDCPLLNNYFDNISPALWPRVAQRDAVYGFGVGQPRESGTAQCHGQGFVNYSPGTQHWDPTVGGPTQSSGPRPDALLPPGPLSRLSRPCVPQDQVYDPDSNPSGVRCSAQDYMVNIFGRRPPSAWGPVEKRIDQGFANRFLDRVGVQYGLKALEDGVITPEQFVDLNEKIGGWDIDRNWQPQRTEADPAAVKRMYRTGQLVEGKQLAKVAIIDYRHDTRADVHANRQAAIIRERMLNANGTVANRAEWIGPFAFAPPLPGSEAHMVPLLEVSFRVIDEWLARVAADRSSLPLPQKIIRNRPAAAADGCFANGERADASVCSEYALDSDPLLAAGMPETRDVLKCRLKPLKRSSYKVEFSDDQWARLQEAFPNGVCDWSKPGVGKRPNIPWLTFEDGPGGQPLGPPPRSVPFGGSPS